MPSLGVIRPDEEPVPKTGRGESLWAFESPRSRCSRPSHGSLARSLTCRDGPEAKTPGPQPGERGSILRRGTPMPGSRAARRPAVNRKAGVRTPPWQLIRCEEARSFHRSTRGHGVTRCKPEGYSRRRPCFIRFTDHICGRRSTARMRARHARDEGSTSSGHTSDRQCIQ